MFPDSFNDKDKCKDILLLEFVDDMMFEKCL